MDAKMVRNLYKGDIIKLKGTIYAISNISYVRSSPRYFMLHPLMPNLTSYKASRETLLDAELLDATSPEVQAITVLYATKVPEV